MQDNDTVLAKQVIEVMKNLQLQAKKLEAMTGVMKMLRDDDQSEPPSMLVLLRGVGKGTEATIHTMFYRLFHEHKDRDALLKEVGLDTEAYYDTAKQVEALQKAGKPLPDVMNLFDQTGQEGTKH